MRKTVLSICILLFVSQAMAWGDKEKCEKFLSTDFVKMNSAVVLLLKHFNKIIENCPDPKSVDGSLIFSNPKKNPFFGIMTGSEMDHFKEKTKDFCRRSDRNKEMECLRFLAQISILNGGPQGQVVADSRSQRELLRKRAIEAAELARAAKMKLYCCTFANHIIYSDKEDKDVCESKPSLCPSSIITISPLQSGFSEDQGAP